MKKILIVIATLFFYMSVAASSPNPIVKRLSPQEIAQCETPAALAYNFVMAIVNQDYNRAMSYMTHEAAKGWEEAGIEAIDRVFATPGKLHILGWWPAFRQGYEVAVLYVQDEGEYNGNLYKKVYIGCVPSSEIGVSGFQDITRFENETNVKVVIVGDGHFWGVNGFK